MAEMIDLLLTRRSVVAASMTQDGPTAEELQTILAAGHRVPDHGKLGFLKETRGLTLDMYCEMHLSKQSRMLRQNVRTLRRSGSCAHRQLSQWFRASRRISRFPNGNSN